MKVYHGSRNLFKTFDYGRIGLNDTLEGKGFYFTDTRRIAEVYGQGGYVYTVDFRARKPLSYTGKTLTKSALKAYLKEMHKHCDYLTNWGDVQYEGLQTILKTAVDGEYEGSDNDVDIIMGIINASGVVEIGLSVLYKTLGYDSIIVDNPSWGREQKIYIALTNSIIKIVSVERGRHLE